MPFHVSCSSLCRLAGGPRGIPHLTVEEGNPQGLSSGEEEEEEEGWEVRMGGKECLWSY